MSRIRLVPTLISFLVAFAVLFGGWNVYRNYGLEHPAEQKLQQIPYVTEAHVNMKGQKRNVTITLSNHIPDLQTTYHALQQNVEQTLGNDTTITVVDHRSNELIQLYQTFQPILFEGIHKGNYTEMIQSIQTTAQHSGVSAKVTMDMNHVYLQMTKGNNQLDEIIPYTNQQGVS